MFLALPADSLSARSWQRVIAACGGTLVGDISAAEVIAVGDGSTALPENPATWLLRISGKQAPSFGPFCSGTAILCCAMSTAPGCCGLARRRLTPGLVLAWAGESVLMAFDQRTRPWQVRWHLDHSARGCMPTLHFLPW